MDRLIDLERDPRFRYALFFKNSGTAAGEGKHRHSRSQLIALPVNPSRIKDELDGCLRYFEAKERCIFCDLIRQELLGQERLAKETSHFVALAPFASRFPFELWVLPKRHAADVSLMNPAERLDLAGLLRETLGGVRKLLKNPPYNMILHTAPFRRARLGYWKTIDHDFHWHLEIMPRLTRVAGFEWGTAFYINPTPPEEAARFLKESPGG
jgi:UDPglucose--hexose-1-phosphate uridylyltransferase